MMKQESHGAKKPPALLHTPDRHHILKEQENQGKGQNPTQTFLQKPRQDNIQLIYHVFREAAILYQNMGT